MAISTTFTTGKLRRSLLFSEMGKTMSRFPWRQTSRSASQNEMNLADLEVCRHELIPQPERSELRTVLFERLRRNPFKLAADDFRQRFDKKVFAPHHRFVDTQVFRRVIHAMFENSFPAGRLAGQI